MKRLALLIVALFSAVAFAQDLPRIAVYVTGNVGDDEKKALGTRMLASLINSKRYRGIERSNSFLAEIAKEQEKQRSGAIDDGQISELGKQFGVKFVCIADITPAFGEFQVSARIVNVETAEVEFIGESSRQLKSMSDLSQVSDQVVRNMFGDEAKPAAKPKTEPVETTPEPKPEPKPPADYAVTASQPEPEPSPAKLEEPESSNIPTAVASKNYDRYFTLRYMPVASPVYLSLPAYNAETGWIWKNGMFFGFDVGGAVSVDVVDVSAIEFGLGLNIGKSFELAHDFNFALGGSLGFWLWGESEYNYDGSPYEYRKDGFSYIGPFVRLRYNVFELSYRILFGTTEEGVYTNGSYYEGEPGLGVINQVGVGLHLEGSDRFGQSRNYDDYFALRYLPVASPVYVSPVAYNIEYGWILGNGMFMGFDVGGAVAVGDDYGIHGGGSFNVGKSFELAPFNLALGGSLGFWGWEYHDERGFSYIGPFVRLRHSIFELSYRFLIGTKEERYGSEPSSGIGVSNQLGIGLYFEGKKRHR